MVNHLHGLGEDEAPAHGGPHGEEGCGLGHLHGLDRAAERRKCLVEVRADGLILGLLLATSPLGVLEINDELLFVFLCLDTRRGLVFSCGRVLRDVRGERVDPILVGCDAVRERHGL
jgi:hypothetical protein